MILELTTLGLALASDASGSEEEAWIQKFEETNILRASYGIPVLTAAERMAWMIGENPISKSHMVCGYVETGKLGTLSDYLVWIAEAKPDLVLGYSTGSIKGFQLHLFYAFRKKFTDSWEVSIFEQEIARKLFLPCSLVPRRPGTVTTVNSFLTLRNDLR
jgi:hypothetical protein